MAMTRRDFILSSGIGMAGTLAASPVRSSCGIRELLSMQNPHDPRSAKNYIQDGLISIWDGIENAGWGEHDKSALRWENLVNENCYATPNAFVNSHGPVFDSTSVVFNKNCYTINAPQSLGIAKYVDILFEADQANNMNSSYLLEMAISGITFQAKGQSALKTGNGNGATLKTTLAKGKIWLFSVDFSTLTASVPYVNGSTIGYNRNGTFGGLTRNTIGRGYWNDNYFIGKMYCIRIYSRPLSIQEIAYNYAIDKIRFNLPD